MAGRPNPRRDALVAAGRRLRLDDQRLIDAYKSRATAPMWHQKAWLYNDEIGELGFAHDYVRDALSRIRIFAAVRPAPDEAPVPIADGDLGDQVASLADATVERLQPHAEFMGDAGFLLDVIGDCHVALVPDPDDSGEPDDRAERMIVLSTDAFKVKDNGWWYRLDDGDKSWIPIDQNRDTVFRMWTSNGRWRNVATSPMRRLLGVCEELLLLSREIRGTALSRLAMNGVLFVSEQLTLASASEEDDADTDDAGDGETGGDPFVEDFITAAATAIQDPDSAAAAIPIIIRGPGEADKVLKHIPFDRKFDPVAAEQRLELLGRIGNGINLPREIVLGMGSTNHWNDEQIDEQTWRIHLEGRVRRILDAAAQAFLRPALVDANIDPAVARQVLIWHDPSGFLGDPDLSDDADGAHDRLVISDEAYRRAKGFSEADAPDDAEVARREARDAAPAFGTATNDDDELDDDAAVTAARQPRSARLGRRLVAIERDLRTRLQHEANAALQRALERAGLTLRNLAARGARNRPLFDQIANVPKRDIAWTLGRAGVQTLGLAEDEIIDDQLADLELTYYALVRRAQHAAARAIAREAGGEIDVELLDKETEEDRNAGWLVFAAGLAALARDRLFTPRPDAPPVGEFDEHVDVPTGLVRAALDRAGGAAITTPAVAPRGAPPATVPAAAESATPGAGGPPAAGGATQGPNVLDVFRQQLGVIADSYEWVYGDEPRREFRPHLDLDGTTFSSWDDPVLANVHDFPNVPYLRPGDHPGCRCDFAVIFTQSTQEG